MDRISKENYYLDIAETVLERATCLRRVYGAIIVKNDEIISTGYNGAPRGRANCVDMGYCSREAMKVPRGERYELCRSVHAEANAIISASRNECIGADRVIVMSNGVIVADGAPKDVFRQSALLRREGLTVPVTTELLEQLSAAGMALPLDALTVDACADAIASALAGAPHP